MASVASFFVSRVDSAIDARLPAESPLRGRAGIANAKLAYANFERVFSGPRFEKLAAEGARVQRPLWASTSVKDPSYPDTMYVSELIGPDTVNTMPTVTLEAWLDHGDPRPDTIREGVDEARSLEAAGIDTDAVTDELLAQGVDKFVQAFDALLEAIADKAGRLSSEPS